MANINTPAHDFAPPWLKIPSYDSNRPSGAESDRGRHASRKEGHSFGSTRHTKDSDTFAPSRHHFYHDTRRERNNFSGERKPPHLSYHHSLDIDDPYFDGNCRPSTYNTNISYNGTSNSSLLRRPHSRHDFRNIPASYAKGDIYNRHVNNTGGFYSKAKGKFSDVNSHNSNNIFHENGGINSCSNNFNQEFPSLQGDIAEEPVSPLPMTNESVWEKHRSMTVHGAGVGKKIQLIKKPFTSDTSTESNKKTASLSLPSSSTAVSSSASPSSISNQHTVIVTSVAKGGSGIYRALIPTKSNNNSKKSILTREVSSKVQPVPKKQPNSVNTASPHSMEILVKHPKAPGNKSDFLKALRNESHDSNPERKEEDAQERCTSEEFGNGSESSDERPHTNGIDIAKLTVNDNEEKPLLSSSLEAEQRLLKEMGWKEDASDDDNYAPLTEDEMREFRRLTEQIPKKNGFRRNLQNNFSPRRLAPFSITLPTDTCSSSSESDSDFDF